MRALIDWRAGCEKFARPVLREGWGSNAPSLPLSGNSLHTGTTIIGGSLVSGGAGQFATGAKLKLNTAGADTTATGDPDGDGMTNQQEYAFGLNPTLGSSVSPITALLDPVTGLLRLGHLSFPG
jgi:hypothetical protein